MVTYDVDQVDIVGRFSKLNEQSKKKKVLDLEHIEYDGSKCPKAKKTWDLICSGYTKGVFQLEGSLGKQWCKKIKPRNLEELSDVIALIRPGCLNADFREKPDKPGEFSSITATYEKVKNGEPGWEPQYLHECLEPVLSKTQSVLVYQEQIMDICSLVAGFTQKEADDMRRAVGKKKKEEMELLKEKFIQGVAAKYDEGLGETIFSWIEKFSDYGFNKSHSISYAKDSYLTAYCKANYPLQFLSAMMENSDSKQDSAAEIHELVHESRLFGIEVMPPDISLGNKDFYCDDEKKRIYYGLSHIKGVGSGAAKSLKKLKGCSSFVDFIRFVFDKSNKFKRSVAEILVKAGGVDGMVKNRIVALAYVKLLAMLTDRELKWALDLSELPEKPSQLVERLLLSGVPNKARAIRLKDKWSEIKKSLAGSTKRMSIAFEASLLGIPLTGSIVEMCANERVNTKCRDFNRLPENTNVILGVVIEEIRQIKDKRKNDMCFMKVSDETYMLDACVVFSRTFLKVGWILEEGKPVLLIGKKDSKGSLVVNDVQHL